MIDGVVGEKVKFAVVGGSVVDTLIVREEVDVALAAFPFEVEALETASSWEIIPGVALRTCSAQHLVIYKLVAGRPQDLVDVAGIVRRQGRRLDVHRIRRWGREFAELKEDPDLLRPFEDALRKSQAT